ncbi:hypothetical protein QBC43DRAFT_73836 [Cladorrhinum sp. PSN259]|nr:hypothetical protein QBC43DRAFT_73836 [Cladorrhinum sp. PSN259]
MSPPRVPSHHSGGRIAATTMASGAPPATSTSKMTTTASQAAAAAANQKPKTQFSFELPGFHIPCSFPGCSAKLDGKRDVFCSEHMPFLSIPSKSIPFTGHQAFAPPPSPPITNGAESIAATVVPTVAPSQPPSQPQPKPSPSPAPDLSLPSPQRQLPILNPRKMLSENEKSRPLILKRKSAANPSRIITQQPTPKHTTPPLIGESAAPTMLPISTTTTTTSAATPLVAPSPAVNSPPISPSHSQSGEPAKKRLKTSESLGDSSESRLNEQTSHRISTPAEAAKRSIAQASTSKQPTILKASEEKNVTAPKRASRAGQPIRKMALPATINFIKPKSSSAGPSPEIKSSSSFNGSPEHPQKADPYTKFNQSFNWPPPAAPAPNQANSPLRSASNGFVNKFQNEPVNSDLPTLKTNQFYDEQPLVNGRAEPNGPLFANAMFQTNGLQKSNVCPNGLFQANQQQQPTGKPQANGQLKAKKTTPSTKPHQPAGKQQPRPHAETRSSTASFDSDVEMADVEDSETDASKPKMSNRVSSKITSLPPPLKPVSKLNIPSRPSVSLPVPSPKLPASPIEPTELDMLIYSQEGASTPPPGLTIPKRKASMPQPRQDDAICLDEDAPPPPKPKEDEPLYANIDPRVHWPQDHSEEWYARKQIEIAARGKRKDNYGKAAQRLREQRLSKPAVSPEEFENSLEEKIQSNPAWVRALKRLNGLSVEDVDTPVETGQVNGVNGFGGGGEGIGSVNGIGEKRIRKLKRTGSGFSIRADLNGTVE